MTYTGSKTAREQEVNNAKLHTAHRFVSQVGTHFDILG